MTYVAEIPYAIPLAPTQNANTLTAAVNILLDAAGESAAFIFPGPDGGGSHDKVIFATNAITGTCTVDIRIETVDLVTNPGFPTGTLVAAGATGQQASLASNTTYEVTLTTPPTLTEGTLYAVVIVYNAGTSINIAGAQFLPGFRPPYGAHFTTAWAHLNTPPICAVRVAGIYLNHPGLVPCNWTAAFYRNSSTPDELGNVFTNSAVKKRAVGIWIMHSAANVAADFDLVLYQGTTAIETISIDASTLPVLTTMLRYFPFTTKRDIEASTLYRVCYRPSTNTASSGTFATFTALNADQMAALPGSGAWYSTTRSDAGSFADVTTAMHMIGLVFDAIDVPAGAGIAQLLGDGLQS